MTVGSVVLLVEGGVVGGGGDGAGRRDECWIWLLETPTLVCREFFVALQLGREREGAEPRREI